MTTAAAVLDRLRELIAAVLRWVRGRPALLGRWYRAKVEAVREWYRDQTAWSLTVGIVGALAVALVTLGSLVLLVVNGLIPYQKLIETALSSPQTTLLWTSVALGTAAMVAGFTRYKAMPTKAARETAISGAALGVLAIVLSAVYLFFRSGDKFDLLVRQNFSLDILTGIDEATGEDLWRSFLTGAKNTVILAASGEGLGIALGLILAMLILSTRVVVRAPARAYINFFRATPLIWQISFVYFGLVLSARLPIDVYQTGMLVLGLNAGAYSAEIFRAGIQSIERGQIEASRSLGMSYMQAMRYVILPQAIRRVIPPLTNEFIILLKDTSLIFILGLLPQERELFGVGRDAYSASFNATPYIGTVIGYLAITLPMIRVVTWLEKKLRSGLTGIVGM